MTDLTSVDRPLIPMPDDFTSVLCVVAHPDDLEYGAASAVARWTGEGKQVRYALVTSGEAGIDGMTPDECGPLREGEERAGAAQVGVADVEFMGHTDGVVEYGLALRHDIAAAIRRHRPELVVTINGGLLWGAGTELPRLNMADHRNVWLAVLDGARDAGNRWIFTDLLEEGLEPWTGVQWVAVSGSADARHAVDITGHLDRGVASLRAHAAYLAGLGDNTIDPDEFLRAMASTAGARAGVEHAVAFELIAI
ncbi:MAG TPA: PIG-L deacetylase family protein [Acidimicrobiales bacterium]|nr:PIG-L deacetylase family protein [Acidimicrobiales bacterium]